MEENSIKGILYLKFEGVSKPMPLVHLPKDLDHAIVTQINKKMLEYFKEKRELNPNKIDIVDLESEEYNGVLMFEEWKDKRKYWGVAKTTIILLTNLEMKKIEEKKENLEPLFGKYVNRIVQLEKKEEEKEEYLNLLQEFREDLINS
ncbi:MAG: hypothetical protein R6U96_09485 [Promethearchaeia archaeon]